MKLAFTIEYPDTAHAVVFAILAIMVRALPNSAKVSIPKTKTFVFYGGDDLQLADPTPIEQAITEATV